MLIRVVCTAMLLAAKFVRAKCGSSVSVYQQMAGQRGKTVLSFVTRWTDLEDVVRTEQSQEQVDTYCKITYMQTRKRLNSKK